MKLHLDRDAFEALVADIGNRTGYREDVLEKDYYVSLLLLELAEMQKETPAYFKGGTALYKALKTIRRFSEDIDLTVATDDCSNSQAKRRLERASSGYKSLSRTNDKSLESNNKGSIVCVYDYDSVCAFDVNDALQRFGHVKVEATSFTVSEPYEAITVEPAVFTQSTDEQRAILTESYDVHPFEINTIKTERIFADKILAAEFYYQRESYFEVAKHLYDIAVLMDIDKIKSLVRDSAGFQHMISYKRREEAGRIGSNLSDMPFSEFSIFTTFQSNTSLKEKFASMQNIYVFNESDKLDFRNVCEKVMELRDILILL